MNNRNFFQKNINETKDILKTNISTGLSEYTAAEKFNEFGKNEIRETKGRSPLKIILDQLLSTMVIILIIATIISAFLGDLTEVIAIAAIVVLFVVLGFTQEYKAERALAALKKLAIPLIRVIRSSKEIEIPATKLVPGDIIILETGNIVPADSRIIESSNLKIQESALTGESEPIDKITEPINADNIPLGDRTNMAFMGTVVTYGRGKAIVTETGMNTELGKIATLIQNIQSDLTPLQKQLDNVGKLLAIAGCAVALIVMAIGFLQGGSFEEMLLTAVSIAVAVVPEGLPAVVTITLALGAQRMLKRHALIRKLPAVETLGSVNIICSDKTGTLTQNKMTVTVVDIAGKYIDLVNQDRSKNGDFKLANNVYELLDNWPTALAVTLAGGTLCNDSSIKNNGSASEEYSFHGDPTEGALLVAAIKAGIYKEQLNKLFPRIDEIPFDSERKRMTTIHKINVNKTKLHKQLEKTGILNTDYISFTKGSVDGLLKISSHVLTDNGVEPLTKEHREKIETSNNKLASKGIRVLGIAISHINSKNKNPEEGLIFTGMLGMIDPPRKEVKEAVHTCKTAGIRPIMITGDHPLTARFIADDLGISDNNQVKTGIDLDNLDDEQLQRTVIETSVYARVSPEHKLKIVKALQSQNNIVAMTGDGVNDSPALKKADIGIAMGITGTDVSKESSEMVLLDDNFATIISSVEEGRVIYDNIKRFICFSVAGNLGKVIVMLFAPVFCATVALLPLQLLWLNLLTDGLLGLGLGVETPEKEVMKRNPRPMNEKIFSGQAGGRILWLGTLIGLIALLIGWFYYSEHNMKWQTMMFTSITFLQIGQALASRSNTESLFKIKFYSNPLLFWMIISTVILQLGIIYIPFFAGIFKVVPLSFFDIIICLIFGSMTLFAVELAKTFNRTVEKR